MRTVTGAILLLAAEQAYAHSCLIAFPDQEAAGQILIPASLVMLGLGIGFLVWGICTEGGRRAFVDPRTGAGGAGQGSGGDLK